jgi:hypothetical protein
MLHLKPFLDGLQNHCHILPMGEELGSLLIFHFGVE